MYTGKEVNPVHKTMDHAAVYVARSRQPLRTASTEGSPPFSSLNPETPTKFRVPTFFKEDYALESARRSVSGRSACIGCPSFVRCPSTKERFLQIVTTQL